MQKIFSVLFCIISIISLCESSSHGQLINGDFSNGLSGWYASGDVSTSGDGAAILRTGSVAGPYMTSLSTDFIISGGILSFKYSFDIVGPDLIKDPDYPSFGPDFFQMSLYSVHGDTLDLPIAWGPTDGYLSFSMDISSLAEVGTEVTLSFILYDEDDGHLSLAAIDDVSNPARPAPEPGTLLLLGGGLVGLFIFTRYKGSNFIRNTAAIIRPLLSVFMGCLISAGFINSAQGELIETNVEEMVSLEFSSPVFNTKSNILTLNMTAANVSDLPLFTPLKVIITGISHPDVRVVNPDGYTSEGLAVWDMTSLIDDKELSSGEKTFAKKVSFYNPGRIKFRWDQDVMAMMDTAPETGPVIYNICLVPGESPPLCEFYYDDPEIKNPAFERLLRKPLPEMFLYQQVRVYAYDNEEIPFNVKINGMDALYREQGFYHFSKLTLKEGMNTISIEATNEDGISTEREISLHIDATHPVIDLTWPVENSIVSRPDQLIIGTVDDPFVSTVMLTRDFINIEDIPVYAGSFSRNITLSPGHNQISLKAADEAGNASYIYRDVVHVYSEYGSITGSVYNRVLGLPVAGAMVSVVSGDDTEMISISDVNGSYRFEGVKSGEVTLRIDRDGYYPVKSIVLSMGGPDPQTQDVALIPKNSPYTLTLTGQITDTGGFPLEGVAIYVANTSLKGVSDPNGIYIITGIPRVSFIAEVNHESYERINLNISGGMYSTATTILTHNFILKEAASPIAIIYPKAGELVSGDTLSVTGLFLGDEKAFGVLVNGVPAQVYGGSFLANNVPLDHGDPRITAEMISPSGTSHSNSISVVPSFTDNGIAEIHSQEASLVPAIIPVEVELPPGITVAEYGWEISGAGSAMVSSNGPLKHTVTISDAGTYMLQYIATDTKGLRYKGVLGLMGVERGGMEEDLGQIWSGLKDALISSRTEDALLLFTPETRLRYAEQFYLLNDNLPDIFSNMGEIELVSLTDNAAKARIHLGDMTHYIWFARDIYGLWKIHKF